jgi:hypothetical protein
MKYDRGDFLIYNPNEIENLNCLDEIDKLMNTEGIIDGIGPYPEKIAVLDFMITDVEGRIPQPIEHRISETSVLCLISSSFTEAVATISYEKLRGAAAAWADSESWKYTDVHSFDLAGFLVGLNALCRKALDESKQLYLLLSSDAD